MLDFVRILEEKEFTSGSTPVDAIINDFILTPVRRIWKKAFDTNKNVCGRSGALYIPLQMTRSTIRGDCQSGGSSDIEM